MKKKIEKLDVRSTMWFKDQKAEAEYSAKRQIKVEEKLNELIEAHNSEQEVELTISKEEVEETRVKEPTAELTLEELVKFIYKEMKNKKIEKLKLKIIDTLKRGYNDDANYADLDSEVADKILELFEKELDKARQDGRRQGRRFKMSKKKKEQLWERLAPIVLEREDGFGDITVGGATDQQGKDNLLNFISQELDKAYDRGVTDGMNGKVFKKVEITEEIHVPKEFLDKAREEVVFDIYKKFITDSQLDREVIKDIMSEYLPDGTE